MDPVGLTRFTTSRNRRLLLLLRKVMAVPLCPSRPALPTWMKRNVSLNRILLVCFPFYVSGIIGGNKYSILGQYPKLINKEIKYNFLSVCS